MKNFRNGLRILSVIILSAPLMSCMLVLMACSIVWSFMLMEDLGKMSMHVFNRALHGLGRLIVQIGTLE